MNRKRREDVWRDLLFYMKDKCWWTTPWPLPSIFFLKMMNKVWPQNCLLSICCFLSLNVLSETCWVIYWFVLSKMDIFVLYFGFVWFYLSEWELGNFEFHLTTLFAPEKTDLWKVNESTDTNESTETRNPFNHSHLNI